MEFRRVLFRSRPAPTAPVPPARTRAAPAGTAPAGRPGGGDGTGPGTGSPAPDCPTATGRRCRACTAAPAHETRDRKSVGQGKGVAGRVEHGGLRTSKKKQHETKKSSTYR